MIGQKKLDIQAQTIPDEKKTIRFGQKKDLIISPYGRHGSSDGGGGSRAVARRRTYKRVAPREKVRAVATGARPAHVDVVLNDASRGKRTEIRKRKLILPPSTGNSLDERKPTT